MVNITQVITKIEIHDVYSGRIVILDSLSIVDIIAIDNVTLIASDYNYGLLIIDMQISKIDVLSDAYHLRSFYRISKAGKLDLPPTF